MRRASRASYEPRNPKPETRKNMNWEEYTNEHPWLQWLIALAMIVALMAAHDYLTEVLI